MGFFVLEVFEYGIIDNMNGGNPYKIRPQADFPFIEEYRKQFDITKYTIFAGGDAIYTDYPLTPDLLVHELVHLRQQEEIGLKEWVYDFLYTPAKRLEYELEAYREQLQSIKDRNHRARIRHESSINLSSSLYGNIINFTDAFELLKV